MSFTYAASWLFEVHGVILLGLRLNIPALNEAERCAAQACIPVGVITCLSLCLSLLALWIVHACMAYRSMQHSM